MTPELTKLPKSIKRITILAPANAPAGQSLGDEAQPQIVERRRRKRSKGFMRIWERVVRDTARAGARTAEEYLARHERSGRKKRDGWLRDYPLNMMRANR